MTDDEPSRGRSTDDLATMGGWTKTLGLTFVHATADEVIAEIEIGPRHLQVHGLVHGGVFASIVESVASAGAARAARAQGRSVVGLDNHTSFVRAVRGGRLRARAVPINRGRTTQLWEGTIRDEQGRVVATGVVRFLCIDDGSKLGDKTEP